MMRLMAAAGAALTLTVSLLAQAPTEGGLVVTHRARAVAPGEVVLVDVSTPMAVKEMHAEWLSQRLVFYPLDERHWQGLAPIDLGAKTGRQPLVIRARTSDGREIGTTYPVAIAPRVFPTRRLSVDAKFVDPPADELSRIERERERVEGIFAKTTAERFWSAPFVVPVPGTPTSSFGRRSVLNGQPRGQHTGTDFQAANATPVVAPNRGRIVLADDHYFPGRTIIIDHGLGLYSYLAHLSVLSVAEGDIVERGQRIALSGSTGRVTGPHLHWTMRLGAARVDPLSLVTVLKGVSPAAAGRGKPQG